jgi:hypothetical protein
MKKEKLRRLYSLACEEARRLRKDNGEMLDDIWSVISTDASGLEISKMNNKYVLRCQIRNTERQMFKNVVEHLGMSKASCMLDHIEPILEDPLSVSEIRVTDNKVNDDKKDVVVKDIILSMNDKVVIYPTEKGWKKIRDIYISKNRSIAIMETYMKTKDDGYEDTMWCIVSDLHEMFFNGQSYFKNTSIKVVKEM